MITTSVWAPRSSCVLMRVAPVPCEGLLHVAGMTPQLRAELRLPRRWQRTKTVGLLDDTRPSAPRTQPASESAEWKSALSLYGRVVSQLGIEPRTRRLRERLVPARRRPPGRFSSISAAAVCWSVRPVPATADG